MGIIGVTREPLSPGTEVPLNIFFFTILYTVFDRKTTPFVFFLLAIKWESITRPERFLDFLKP